jgi:hypothetical protein
MLRNRHLLVFLSAIGTLGGWAACQGPDQFFRNSAVETGTGGSALIGAGGFSASGGAIGAAGMSGGTGGVIASGTGGTKGTGSVTGTGGGSATGGTGGTKATGGTTGGSGGAGGKGSVAAIEIDTYCEAPATKQLNVYVDVLNKSTTGLPLSQVTFRYWFTMGAISDTPTLDVFYTAFNNSGAVTFKYMPVSPAVSGANEYLEVGFTSTAPTLSLLTDSGQIQISLRSSSYTDGFDPNPTADYSFQACTGTAVANDPPFAPAPTITGYVNGVLAWGTEPQ